MKQLKVGSLAATDILEVSYISQDPEQAANVVKQLQTVRIAESQDPRNVRVISNAVVPTKPVSSRAVGYLASGSLALLAAAGVIYLLECCSLILSF